MGRSATRRTVLAGLMGAMLLICKETLAPLPGEPVTPLILLYTLEFPAVTPWAIAVFVVLQFVLYGFGLWSWMYLYIWFLLYGLVRLLRRMDSAPGWAVVAGAYGRLARCAAGLSGNDGPAAPSPGGWRASPPTWCTARAICRHAGGVPAAAPGAAGPGQAAVAPAASGWLRVLGIPSGKRRVHRRRSSAGGPERKTSPYTKE
ncbi:MAG: hypothetical protein ACLTNY_08600 [Blautia massiliensis (ex Durand et al. 2017)]